MENQKVVLERTMEEVEAIQATIAFASVIPEVVRNKNERENLILGVTKAFELLEVWLDDVTLALQPDLYYKMIELYERNLSLLEYLSTIIEREEV